MQTVVENKVTITLVLNTAEARWLNAVMQNPLHDVHPSEENPEDAKMRASFFEATKEAQIK